MAYLTRPQVKNIVINSLIDIADLPPIVEAATFDMLNDMQKDVFLNALKNNINTSPYYFDDGTTGNTSYYDIDLNEDSIAGWPTVGDCINWITANQIIYPKTGQP